MACHARTASSYALSPKLYSPNMLLFCNMRMVTPQETPCTVICQMPLPSAVPRTHSWTQWSWPLLQHPFLSRQAPSLCMNTQVWRASSGRPHQGIGLLITNGRSSKCKAIQHRKLWQLCAATYTWQSWPIINHQADAACLSLSMNEVHTLHMHFRSMNNGNTFCALSPRFPS